MATNADSEKKNIEELNKSIGVLGEEIDKYAFRVEEIIAMLKAKQSTNINDVALEKEKQAELAQELYAAEEEIDRLESEVEQNAKVIGNQTTEVSKLNEDMASAAEQISNKDKEVVRLQEEIKTKLDAMALLEGDIKIQNSELVDLRNKLADKELELQSKTLANDQQTEANTTIIEGLTGEKKALETAITEQQKNLSGQIEALENQNITLSGKIANLENAIIASENKNKEDEAKVKALEAQAEQMAKTIEGLQKTVDANSNLQTNIDELNTEKYNLSQQNNECQKKINALNAQIELSDITIKELIEKVKQLTAGLDQHTDVEPVATEDEVDNVELGDESKDTLLQRSLRRNFQSPREVLSNDIARPEAREITVKPAEGDSQSEKIVNEAADLQPLETPKIKLQQVNKTDFKILDTPNGPVEYDFHKIKDLPIQDGYNWVAGFIDSNGNSTTPFKKQQRFIKKRFMKGFIDESDKTLNQRVRLFTRINATANNAEPQYFIEYKEPESSTASSTSSSTSSSTASSTSLSDAQSSTYLSKESEELPSIFDEEVDVDDLARKEQLLKTQKALNKAETTGRQGRLESLNRGPGQGGGKKPKAKSQKKHKTHKSRKPQKTNKHQKTNKRRKTHKRRNNKTTKRH